MSRITRYPFSATIVRYQHDAALGERINIGVVLVCGKRKFAQARFQNHLARLSAAFPGASLPNIKATCRAIASIIREHQKQPGLFDGQTPVDFVNRAIPEADAAFATSEVLKGVTGDPSQMLEDLFRIYVDVQQHEGARHRDEQEIMTSLFTKLHERKVPRTYFAKRSVGPDEYQLTFKHVWVNGCMHALQPVSFDLSAGDTIREKAASWTGRLHAATPWAFGVKPHIIIARPPEDTPKLIRKAARDGRKLLLDQFSEQLSERKLQIIGEEESDQIVDQIASDYREHHR